MDKDAKLKTAVLEFNKYLKQQKLKEKPTILELGQSKMRVNIFRTDGLFDITRDDARLDHIGKIFKPAGIAVSNEKEVEQLLNLLVDCKYLMKLDRASTKLKTPNYKWPKTMVLHPVS